MKDNRELVSVIIPVYNGEKYLKESLESVLNQTYEYIEILVIDDGSTDRSIEIAKSLNDEIRVIIQKNRGPAAARNNGAKCATGRWLAFLDADDTWEPEKLEKQVNACKKFKWSYTNTQFNGGQNNGRLDSDFTKKYEGDILEHIITGNFISTSSVMVDKECFITAGGFDEGLKSIQDWELWSRIAIENPINYIPEALVNYRVHSNSTSRKTRNTLPNHIRVIEKIFSNNIIKDIHTAKLNQAKSKSYSICSYIAEEEKDYSFSLYCAFKASVSSPYEIRKWKRTLKSLVKYFVRK